MIIQTILSAGSHPDVIIGCKIPTRIPGICNPFRFNKQNLTQTSSKRLMLNPLGM